MSNWKQNPILRALINPFMPLIKAYYQRKRNKEWQNYLQNNTNIQINIGAATSEYPGWFGTDIGTEAFYFDVTDENCYISALGTKKINNILAEHVFEHLTTTQIKKAVPLMYKYTTEDTNIRIAVPDGFHPDPNYIEQVKINGLGVGADDHKQLFNYHSLKALFEEAGFISYLVEYWDEGGVFHPNYKNDDKGYIKRSLLNDKRNINQKPIYTSLIIDFRKN